MRPPESAGLRRPQLSSGYTLTAIFQRCKFSSSGRVSCPGRVSSGPSGQLKGEQSHEQAMGSPRDRCGHRTRDRRRYDGVRIIGRREQRRRRGRRRVRRSGRRHHVLARVDRWCRPGDRPQADRGVQRRAREHHSEGRAAGVGRHRRQDAAGDQGGQGSRRRGAARRRPGHVRGAEPAAERRRHRRGARLRRRRLPAGGLRQGQLRRQSSTRCRGASPRSAST